MVSALVSFALPSLLLVLLPGPDTLVVVRNIVRGGRRGAAATVAGVVTGLVIWIAAVSVGLAALLQASEFAYTALRYVGGAYLVWVGVQAWRSQRSETARGRHSKARPLLGSGYVAGLLTNLLNPKNGVTFVTILPAFIPASIGAGTGSVALGGLFIVQSLLYFTVLILLAQRLVSWMNTPRIRRRIDRTAGTIFIGFGVRLATER